MSNLGLDSLTGICETLDQCASHLHLVANVDMQNMSKRERFALFLQLTGTAHVLDAASTALNREALAEPEPEPQTTAWNRRYAPE